MTEPNAAQDGTLKLSELQAAADKLRHELAKVIIGQDDVVDQLLIALFAGGHCILEGVPGLAKTKMISTLAACLDLSFSRIQFTPDLMPADITGTEVMQEDRASGTREFKFLQGPIFSNVILADEINRTPPKTQSALLEAMQERYVTAAGRRHPLPEPFFVLATQNPIEQEGTYPLPEAQQDRFLFKVQVDYPNQDEEISIVEATTSQDEATVTSVMGHKELVSAQRLVRSVPAARDVVEFAVRIARASRPNSEEAATTARELLNWGAGPRAAQALILAAKTRAALGGRTFAANEDVGEMALPVLRHRIVLNFSAEAEGLQPDDVVRRLLADVDPHYTEATQHESYRRALAT